MNNKNVTIAEFQAMLGEGYDYLMVSAFVKFLVKSGVAKEVGKKAMPAGQRGKPSTVYEIPNEVEIVFWDNADGSETVPVVPESGVELPASENPPSEVPPVPASIAEKVS